MGTLSEALSKCVSMSHQGTHRTGKTGKMAKRIPCQGKHREFGNFAKTQGIRKFCQNTGNLEILPKHREFGNFAKTQGIWFAQVVNSLILKVKDTAIYFFPRSWIGLPSQFRLCNSHK